MKLTKDKNGFERYSPTDEARLLLMAKAAGHVRLGAGRGALVPETAKSETEWRKRSKRMHAEQKSIALTDKPAENTFIGRFKPSATKLSYDALPIVVKKKEEETVKEYADYLKTI